jgi:hypothetical protein
MTRKVREPDKIRALLGPENSITRDIWNNTKAFTLPHRMKGGITMLCGHEEETESDDFRGPCLSLGGGGELCSA